MWTRRLAPAPGEWALGARQAHPWGPERGGGGSSGTQAELCAAARERGLEHPQCASASAGTRRSTHTRPRVFTRSTRHPHPLPSSQPRRCPQAASVQGSLGENWRPGLAPGPRGRGGRAGESSMVRNKAENTQPVRAAAAEEHLAGRGAGLAAGSLQRSTELGRPKPGVERWVGWRQSSNETSPSVLGSKRSQLKLGPQTRSICLVRIGGSARKTAGGKSIERAGPSGRPALTSWGESHLRPARRCQAAPADPHAQGDTGHVTSGV